MARFEIEVDERRNPEWRNQLPDGMRVISKLYDPSLREVADELLDKDVLSLGNTDVDTLKRIKKAGLTSIEQLIAAKDWLHTFTGLSFVSKERANEVINMYIAKLAPEQKEAVEARMAEHTQFWKMDTIFNVKKYLILQGYTTESKIAALYFDYENATKIEADYWIQNQEPLGLIRILYERRIPKNI